MVVKIRQGNELYVYMNGSLLYKRWINDGYGKVFCDVWGWRPFTSNDVTHEKNKHGQTINTKE